VAFLTLYRESQSRDALGISQLRGLFDYALPRALHVPGLRVGLADAKAKREFAIEFGMGEKKITAGVQPFHQNLIGLILIGMISRSQPKAD
jgi:hypothetical protein